VQLSALPIPLFRFPSATPPLNQLYRVLLVEKLVLSPASYLSHVLSASLYLLVAGVAMGYGIVLSMIEALDRYPVVPQTSEAESSPGIIGFMARWRWFWIPPLYALALLFLLIVTLTQGASTAQFMYNKF
jgi:hypothetical protein